MKGREKRGENPETGPNSFRSELQMETDTYIAFYDLINRLAVLKDLSDTWSIIQWLICESE